MTNEDLTADELLAKLEKDPQFVRRRAERASALEERRDELRRSSISLIEDLFALGIQVDSVWDLLTLDADFSAALPVLIKHLQTDLPDAVREGIARAVSRLNARQYWDLLFRLYEREPATTRSKEGLALALANSADETVCQDLIRATARKNHGESRILLLDGLVRLGTAESLAALDVLASDPMLTLAIADLKR